MSRGKSGHKPNWAKKGWRERFKRKHPEGAKAWAKKKREARLKKINRRVVQ